MVDGGVMCIQCGKIFTTISNGSRHVREAHRPNVQAQCQICKRFYKNERLRNNHLKYVHGITTKQMKNVIHVSDHSSKSNPEYFE